MKIHNLPDKEFKVKVIKMLPEHRKNLNKEKENTRKVRGG